MRRLLSGNEAIALGAYHAGVSVATAYPGTPSTEILENLARLPGPYVEWSANEKVAMEVGLGASYGGVRALVSMKHVGLNVAADPFFAASVTGVRGGLVVVSCDDPGMHSSQGEQDNRHFARFAKIPMLEPSDSQEAYDLMSIAFQLSEEFDTPVMVRSTTRISHCKGVVEIGEAASWQPKRPRFIRDLDKFVMVPSNARKRRPLMEERVATLARWADNFPKNEVIIQNTRLGVIASGAAYQYAREVFKKASFLKLVATYPLPKQLIADFSRQVETLVVVEELDPFMEEQIRAMGLEVKGKEFVPPIGELTIDTLEDSAHRVGLLKNVRRALSRKETQVELPVRPPVLCAGCPHIATSFVLRRLGFYRHLNPLEANEGGKLPSGLRQGGIIATSDIGCYTLAVYPPLLALDTCACMGASIGQALGLEKAGVANKIVAVIGDSTFVHSGITGLVDMVYNQSAGTVVILDNDTTGMTGHQGHPGTGISPRGEKLTKVDLEYLCRGLGVRDVNVVNAFDIAQIEHTLRRCVESEETSVIIARGPCPLKERPTSRPFSIDADRCDGCATCLRLGCPALLREGDKATIDKGRCVGDACGICLQVCPREAIVRAEKEIA
ncbi:MAG: indolepyruvate ferredoxin oxidoreductase subunit alpha [Chloroflexi bacterium]|nr:indolepyruvate ferredoxin oxidoreductase subunit alpha [Chloroflexota bacterium]